MVMSFRKTQWAPVSAWQRGRPAEGTASEQGWGETSLSRKRLPGNQSVMDGHPTCPGRGEDTSQPWLLLLAAAEDPDEVQTLFSCAWELHH